MTADTNPPGMTQEKPSNGLGLAGFIVSLAGLVLTCGLLCPIGLILSLFGLRKQPKGMAIAGVVIGALGTVFLVLVGGGLAMTYLGLKKVAEESGSDMKTTISLTAAMTLINSDRADKGKLPDAAAGNALIANLKDSAGHALRYEPSGDKFLIRAAGKDGVFDTPDDATMETSVK